MTIDPLALVAVVLLAVLVGSTIPVLLQLRATLKSAQQFLDNTSVRVEATLKDVGEVTARTNRLVGELETTLGRGNQLLARLEPVADSVDTVQRSLKTVALIGPAAFAAARSFMSSLLARHGAPAEAAESEEPQKDPYHDNDDSPRASAVAG